MEFTLLDDHLQQLPLEVFTAAQPPGACGSYSLCVQYTSAA
jgi:hypothetical protein